MEDAHMERDEEAGVSLGPGRVLGSFISLPWNFRHIIVAVIKMIKKKNVLRNCWL